MITYKFVHQPDTLLQKEKKNAPIGINGARKPLHPGQSLITSLVNEPGLSYQGTRGGQLPRQAGCALVLAELSRHPLRVINHRPLPASNLN